MKKNPTEQKMFIAWNSKSIAYRTQGAHTHVKQRLFVFSVLRRACYNVRGGRVTNTDIRILWYGSSEKKNLSRKRNARLTFSRSKPCRLFFFSYFLFYRQLTDHNKLLPLEKRQPSGQHDGGVIYYDGDDDDHDDGDDN